MAFVTREYTNKVLELVDEGIVDKDWLIQGLLMWMSEHEVEQFYDANLRPDEEEEEEDDFLEDFNSVGSPHHY